MGKTAKIFTNGRSQAVRLPTEFRFDTKEVYIRRDPKTGDVILSKRPNDWDEFFRLREGLEVPDDFPYRETESDKVHSRDPFEGWEE